MILELFLSLIAIFFVMIYLGYKAETPLFSMLGYFFIFLLAFTLIGNNLEVRSGYTEITSRDNACCNSTGTARDTNAVTYTYTSVSNTKSYGIYLAIGSAVMFILTLIQSTKLSESFGDRFNND